ncbi:hypothetical protein BH23GEM6_BH23GEM6_24510 [soil metagenome]
MRQSQRRASQLIICAAALLSVIPACEPARPDGTPAETTGAMTMREAEDPAMQQRSECVNPIESYAVEYPAGWHVNDAEILGPCSLFDPDPIQVPRDSEVPIDMAIIIGFEPVPIATLGGEVIGRRAIASERTTVDGREAIRIEGETTGEGLHPPGIRSYEYFVDLGDTTMVAATYDVGALDFRRKNRILDSMMATFDFRQP